MTGEEKRKKLKEEMKAAYKRDLQKRKEFQEKMKTLRHTQKMNNAIGEIISGLTSDDSDEWIDKLNRDTVLSEAKTEMALDDVLEEGKELDKLKKQAEAEKFSASRLVEEMKKEMGLIDEELFPEEKNEKKDDEGPKRTLGDF
ncbi:MAG: hypothetical protein KDE26_17430 [Bacteroidetes bacterium]|nr:hypothetical protein [Bacteroidota bacterium]MCB0845038.1 hypothetical protein [Bacteroidota bacterium]